MRMKITTAGRAKLVNDPNTGTNTVLISHIGLTATGFTPTAAMTQLPGEFKRMTSFGGKSVAADTIHVTLQDSGAEKYTLRGFGLYLSDGTLFAVYGQADAIMEKASISTLLLSADVVFADIDTAQIKFGSTEFLNPPATTEVAGVLELATDAETATGNDTTRGVTPRGLKATLDGRFGAGAPTPFVKTLLALATAAAIRTSLELKGAALKDMGHGKGLDADTLDGLHASDFPQVGEVQTSYPIATNNSQKRWIKLGTLMWSGSGASILMLEVTCGGIGGRRFVTDFVSASARGYDTWLTALTPAHADAMVYQARLGATDALSDGARFGLVLMRNSAGDSTGVELWMMQGVYNHGHRVRPVNVSNTTYHGVKEFLTAEPAGIVYASVEPVASASDLRRLVESTESRWGRRQTFALGLTLPSEQTIELGASGGTLRGTDTGSVVMAAGAGETGGFVYLRPNGTSSAAGQLVVYKNGSVEMVSARIGAGGGTADGSVLLEFNSQRPWQFRQLGKDGDTALELFDTSGGKQFRLTNTSNSRAIIFNSSAGLVEAPEFRGMLNGNANTATKLSAARTINGIAFDGTANVVTPQWGAVRKVTIGATAKDMNGGANMTWTLAEIGAGSAADVAARVAYMPPTTNDDAWIDAWNVLRINRQGNPNPTTMPAQYTIAWSLPAYDNSRGLALACDYGGGNRFWMRSRRDTAPADQRWKAWCELWTEANFNPATKADLSGADFSGAVTAPAFKAVTNAYIGGPKYAVLAPDAADGEVLLRPNGGGSVVGQLSVTKAGVRWDGKGMWHSGNFEPAVKADRIPGQIIMFAGKSAPSGTLICNGAAVSRTTYSALFDAIGTLYGAGDGKTTFNLPAMAEGTVVTHTQTAASVGSVTAGEVIRHAHTASSASAGSHTHTLTVAGGGAHSHSASAAAAGEHAHGAWTDQQGHHGHTGGTSAAGDHQHLTAYAESGAQYPWGADYGQHMGSRGNIDYDNPWPYTSPAGGHAHSFTTDGAGAHGHNIGMNNAGNHTHTVSVAQVGDHGHSASAADAGAHTHGITVANTGGDRNLPAGLRMIYCITF